MRTRWQRVDEVIIQPRWQGKSKSIYFKRGKEKKKREQHKSMGGRSVNATHISRSKVEAFAKQAGKGKKKMISHHKAEVF